jgi:hypothetical protein
VALKHDSREVEPPRRQRPPSPERISSSNPAWRSRRLGGSLLPIVAHFAEVGAHPRATFPLAVAPLAGVVPRASRRTGSPRRVSPNVEEVPSAPSGRVRRAPQSAAGCGEPGTNLGHEVLGETGSPRRVSPNVEEVPSAECPIGPGSTRPSKRSGVRRTRHELGARGTGEREACVVAGSRKARARLVGAARRGPLRQSHRGGESERPDGRGV